MYNEDNPPSKAAGICLIALISIPDSVDVKEEDLIIEVGPGQGALTKFLKLFNKN